MSDHGSERDPATVPDDIPELALIPDEGPEVGQGWMVGAALLAVIAVVAVAVGLADLRSPSGTETAEGADRDHTALAVIGLTPAGPRDGLDSLRLPITVEPSTDLVDGQTVTVSGSQYPPHEALGVVMCSGVVDQGGGSAQCQLSPFTQVHSDAAGNFSVEFPMRRLIVVGGEVIDCADPVPEGLDIPSTCVVAVGALADYDQSGIAPISFDASVPAPQPPTLSVTPSEGLVDGDLVTVTLSGFDEEWGWWPQVCTTLTWPEDSAGGQGLTTSLGSEHGEVWCEPVGGTYSDVIAGGSHQVAISRWFGTTMGIEPIDCGSEPGRCWIEVYSGPLPIDPAPLGFDPSVPAGPPPPPPTYLTPETTEWPDHPHGDGSGPTPR